MGQEKYKIDVEAEGESISFPKWTEIEKDESLEAESIKSDSITFPDGIEDPEMTETSIGFHPETGETNTPDREKLDDGEMVCPVCTSRDIEKEHVGDVESIVENYDEAITYANDDKYRHAAIVYTEAYTVTSQSVIKSDMMANFPVYSVGWIGDATCRVFFSSVEAECGNCGFTWEFNHEDVETDVEPEFNNLIAELNSKDTAIESLLEARNKHEKLFHAAVDRCMEEISEDNPSLNFSSTKEQRRAQIKAQIQSRVEENDQD